MRGMRGCGHLLRAKYFSFIARDVLSGRHTLRREARGPRPKKSLCTYNGCRICSPLFKISFFPGGRVGVPTGRSSPPSPTVFCRHWTFVCCHCYDPCRDLNEFTVPVVKHIPVHGHCMIATYPPSSAIRNPPSTREVPPPPYQPFGGSAMETERVHRLILPGVRVC